MLWVGAPTLFVLAVTFVDTVRSSLQVPPAPKPALKKTRAYESRT